MKQQQEKSSQNQRYDNDISELDNIDGNGQGQDWWKKNKGNPYRGKRSTYKEVSGKQKMTERNDDVDNDDDTNGKPGILKEGKRIRNDTSITEVRAFLTM